MKLLRAWTGTALRTRFVAGALSVLPLLYPRLAFLGAPLRLAASPGIKVWVIGDCYRVDPLSGFVFEQNDLLFSDSPSGDLTASNIVSNGAAKTVSLRAARNETVAFQLVIEMTGDEKLSDIQVLIGDLTGPGGARIGDRNIDLYKEWYVDVTKRSAQNYSLGTGWYADALIPVSHWSGRLFPRSYVMPFDIPDLMNNISLKQRNHAFWIDINVPKESAQAPPGTDHAQVRVSSLFTAARPWTWTSQSPACVSNCCGAAARITSTSDFLASARRAVPHLPPLS